MVKKKKKKTVPPFVTAHAFCASREFTKLKRGDFGAVNDYVERKKKQILARVIEIQNEN